MFHTDFAVLVRDECDFELQWIDFFGKLFQKWRKITKLDYPDIKFWTHCINFAMNADESIRANTSVTVDPVVTFRADFCRTGWRFTFVDIGSAEFTGPTRFTFANEFCGLVGTSYQVHARCGCAMVHFVFTASTYESSGALTQKFAYQINADPVVLTRVTPAFVKTVVTLNTIKTVRAQTLELV